MRYLYFFLSLSVFLIACSDKLNKPSEDTEVKDGMFIHITNSYDDPHRVLMPLKMASIMADDKDVLIYMDIHAVEFLTNGSKDITFEGFKSAHTYIRMLLDKGVSVYACPTCLKIAGYTPNDLIPGIQIAQKNRFYNFTQGKIISLDY